MKVYQFNLWAAIIYALFLIAIGSYIPEQIQMIYIVFAILSLVLHVFLYYKVDKEPIFGRNPLVVLIPYLNITIVIFVSGGPDSILFQWGYLFTVILVSINFQRRVSSGIAILSAVTFALIQQTSVSVSSLEILKITVTGFVLLMLPQFIYILQKYKLLRISR